MISLLGIYLTEMNMMSSKRQVQWCFSGHYLECLKLHIALVFINSRRWMGFIVMHSHMGCYSEIRIEVNATRKISSWRQYWIKEVTHTHKCICCIIASHIFEIQRQANIFGDRDQQSNHGGMLTGIEQDSMSNAVPCVDLSIISMGTYIHTNSSNYAFRFISFAT